MTHLKLARQQLGSTGIVMSIVGVGAHSGVRHHKDAKGEFPDSEKAREALVIATVQRGIELGVNYFDTAPKYHDGESQRLLGYALAKLTSEERADLVISTKVGWQEQGFYYDYDSVSRSLEQSLKLLGRIDIVYIHDPMNYEQFRQAFGREGAYKTLRKMQEQRIIRAVGIGVRTHHFLMQAIREGVDVILPSFDFSPLRSSAEPIIECARRHGVAVVNASPYVGGLLAGPNPHEQAMRYKYIATNCPSDVDRASALWQWAQTTGLSIGALAVQWSVRNSSVTTTLFGPRTPEELEQNVAHAQETIATPDFELLKTFARSLGPWEEGIEQSWR